MSSKEFYDARRAADQGRRIIPGNNATTTQKQEIAKGTQAGTKK